MPHVEPPTPALTEEGQYRLLINSITDHAIYMLDSSGHVTSWNPGARRFKGYETAEILGQHFSRFYTAEDRAAGEPQAALDTAAREGRFEKQGWRVRKDGTRFLANVVLDPIRGADGTVIGFAKITRDVTEWEASQQALRQAREVLFQSQKMEAVGQLTGGIAHDFNNLLTGIGGCLDLIQARSAQGRTGELDRFIVEAQASVKRAALLIHRLLAFSRQQTLSPKATDVDRLVAGMEELIRRTAGPEIAVEVTRGDGLWTTLVDPNQLEGALLNLCINARDAMPAGGRLAIATANNRFDGPTALGHGLADGEYVSLCVTDTGTGMTPEVARRAFDPFFTTKPDGQGTGLGLSMISGFAQQSGGQARIFPGPGKGSTVCVYLPRHQGALNPEDAPAEASRTSRAAPGETVLVVDDEPTVRLLVTEVLSELGYAALEAGEAASGLKLLRSDARIDLLITDIGLPGGMNGRQLVDLARQSRPGLKVLFITGYDESAIHGDAIHGDGILQPGMQVLAKPFTLNDLAGRIRNMVGHARP